MTFPVEQVAAWADQIAFIRENGQQVTYADRMIPATRQAHDEMLRALLAWHRSLRSSAGAS